MDHMTLGKSKSFYWASFSSSVNVHKIVVWIKEIIQAKHFVSAMCHDNYSHNVKERSG